MKLSPNQRHYAAQQRRTAKAKAARKARATSQDYEPTCIESLVTALWCQRHDAPWQARSRTCDGVQ